MNRDLIFQKYNNIKNNINRIKEKYNISDKKKINGCNIEELNKQIEELNKRLEESQKLLDQQQKLHAMAEQKIQLLEHKETSKTDNKDQTEEINQLKEQLDREKKSS